MTKITALGSPEPEKPRVPKTLDEQVAEYRVNYRKTLQRTVNVFSLPLRNMKLALRAAVAGK